MTSVNARLAELDIELPQPERPVANYVGTKRSGELLFVSARVSRERGEVGTELSTDDAYQAARRTMLLLLAIIREDVDLDTIASVEKLNGFVRSAATFTEQPRVIDGASDLLVDVFGDPGRHARTATGVAQLPYGAAVQLELILRMAEPAFPEERQ